MSMLSEAGIRAPRGRRPTITSQVRWTRVMNRTPSAKFSLVLERNGSVAVALEANVIITRKKDAGQNKLVETRTEPSQSTLPRPPGFPALPRRLISPLGNRSCWFYDYKVRGNSCSSQCIHLGFYSQYKTNPHEQSGGNNLRAFKRGKSEAESSRIVMVGAPAGQLPVNFRREGIQS